VQLLATLQLAAQQEEEIELVLSATQETSAAKQHRQNLGSF
jgi:hypothetical protein